MEYVYQLMHASTTGPHRKTYNSSAFSAGTTSVVGERVLLMEDTWVTGATAISAAGALLREGASGVMVMPIARAVSPSFW